MRINALNNFNINFLGRKKEIRQADGIMRQTKRAFPMMSNTYRYIAVKPSVMLKYKVSESDKERKFYTDYRNKYWHLNSIVSNARMQEDKAVQAKKPCKPVLKPLLDTIKTYKLGNCYESAAAALAVLCANGYYNSQICTLQYTTEFKNKSTGETEYITEKNIDHVVVLTDMNSGGEQNIVIDPWLGTADSKEGAVAKYKSIYQDTKLSQLRREAIYDAEEVLNCHYYIEKKCNISSKINFRPRKNNVYNRTQLKRLGKYTRENYPETLIRRF